MDEVYISGALTAIADGARARVFYELLAEIVAESGLRAYLPHRPTDPVSRMSSLVMRSTRRVRTSARNSARSRPSGELNHTAVESRVQFGNPAS